MQVNTETEVNVMSELIHHLVSFVRRKESPISMIRQRSLVICFWVKKLTPRRPVLHDNNLENRNRNIKFDGSCHCQV